MLSGLFKRKDKKSKSSEDDGEDLLEKHSAELSRASPTPKTSSESVSSPEARTTKQVGPQRQSSKLQKQPPDSVSQAIRDPYKEPVVESPVTGKEISPKENQRSDQTIRQVVLDEVEEISGSSRSKPYEADRDVVRNARIQSPSKKPMSPSEAPNTRQNQSPQALYSQQSITSPPQRFPPQQSTEPQSRLLDSPISASSPLERSSPSVPGLTTDLSPSREHLTSPDSPPLSPADTTDSRRAEAIQTPFEVPTPTWSDASLRSYLEDDHELRDLYVIVYDNTNIPPAGPEHPITGNLFKDESKRLKEMNSQLDSMLSDWVTRRVRKSTSQ
jgi:hypothetical protein